jgi:hypothetical protein
MCFDLKYAVEHGIIDVPAVRSMIEMEKGALNLQGVL